MKIAICEDNLKELEEIKIMLEKTKLFDGAEYYLYPTGDELCRATENGERFDFVFLDVDMPGKNGIETGKEICKKSEKSIIIFITAYPQYAIDAYDCNAFHYVLKTDSYERVFGILKKAFNKYKILNRFYTIETKVGPVKLGVEELYYIECCRKHLIFYTSKGKYESRMPLKKALDDLSGLDFFRIHQGFIVNLQKIVGFLGNDALLDNGEKVMVSVRKRKDALKAYSEYIERNF